MSFKISKTWQAWDDIMNFLTSVATGADKGLSVKGGQFSVGARGQGYEAVFGEGDSIPLTIGSDYAFHYDIANESGNIITGATNITEAIQAEDANTVGLFNGVTAGKVLLFGFDSSEGQVHGLKVVSTALGTIEPENVIGEYYGYNDAWAEQYFMATNADYPYNSHGWELDKNLRQQIRFGYNPLDPADDLGLWTAKTLNINGVDYTKYWVRARLTADITADQIIEQVKLHTNRTEINADGVNEFFGRARGMFTLQEGIRVSIPNASYNPSNENVGYFDGGDAGYQDNEFSANAVDGFMLVQNIKEGLDTSIPLMLEVSYHVKGTSTGSIEWQLDYDQVFDGYVYNQDSAPQGTIITTEVISSNSDDVRRTTTFLVPMNKVGSEGGAVVVALRRNSDNDTLNNSIVLTDIAFKGARWKV